MLVWIISNADEFSVVHVLVLVVSGILGFNLETNNSKIFVHNPESYFGYKVCHFGSKYSNR